MLKIRNGNVLINGKFRKTNIYAEKGIIREITPRDLASSETIDAFGKVVIPGIIDPHVHFELQQGEFKTSGDFETACKMALSRGVTTVIDYIPAGESDFRKEPAFINYSFHKVVGKGFNTKDIIRFIKAGISSFKAFTTYGKSGLMLDDGNMLDLMAAVKKHNAVIEVHCENDSVIEHNMNALSPGAGSPDSARPPIAEIEAVSRMCLFALNTGARTHIVHVSCPESIGVIKEYVKRGAAVTCETCPQYVFLDDSLLHGPEWPLYASCPPLRSAERSRKMRELLLKGSIDMISTDHCSFEKELKLKHTDVRNMPYGIPSAGYSALLFLELFGMKRAGTMSFLMSRNPAAVFGIEKRGLIKKGYWADLVILSPCSKEKLDIPPYDTSGYCPFGAFSSSYAVETVIVNGFKAFERGTVFTKNGSFLPRTV